MPDLTTGPTGSTLTWVEGRSDTSEEAGASRSRLKASSSNAAVAHLGGISQHEQQLRDELALTPERQLVEWATSLLADTIERLPASTAAMVGETPIHRFRSYSYVLIAVRTYRAIRAGVAALEAGFEEEAEVYDRVLVELFGHYMKIAQDESGQFAKRWVGGKKLTLTAADLEAVGVSGRAYGYLSERSHGGAAPVWQALLERDGQAGIVTWGPHRTPKTRAALISYSSFATAMIKILATEERLEVPDQARLEGTVMKLVRRFRADYATEPAAPGRKGDDERSPRSG